MDTCAMTAKPARGPSRMGARRRLERGVTLPEMLVVLAILGLFLLVALPAASNYMRSARIRTAADAFVKDLQSCRYIAVTTRQNRTMSLGGSYYQFNDVRGNPQVVNLPTGVTVTGVNFPVVFTQLGGVQGGTATATVTGRLTPTRSHVYSVTINTT